MATLLMVTCRACGASFEQIDGPLMMGFSVRCEGCGETKFVDIEDVYAGDPPGLEPGSAKAWRLRFERIRGIAGTCACGGAHREDAPIRCPTCRSTMSRPS